MRDSCADGSEGAEPNPEPCAEGDYTLFYAAAFLFGIMDCAIQVRSRCWPFLTGTSASLNPLLLTLPGPQSNTSAICADDFPDRSAEAFGLYRSFQAAVSCALFFVTPTFSADGERSASRDTLISDPCRALAVWTL